MRRSKWIVQGLLPAWSRSLPTMSRRLAAIALALVLIGCTPDSPALREARTPAPAELPQPATVAELAGRKWVVDSVTPSPANAFEWSRLGISLELDAATATASGFGGCNRWSAGFTSNGPGEIAFMPARATQMACAEPEGAMDREHEFLNALPGTHRVTRSEDHLYLERDGSQIVLILDDA
jgi:heat shock protein HslJ